MSSHPEPQSEHKPAPAYVRVFRAYLRNVSSPAVWAPMAIIALLLALSADYWNSLRILDEDLDGSLISENTSQLAGSLSDSGSINASEIDSSDVLSSLLAQGATPVTSEKDDSKKNTKEQNKPPKLDEIDLLDLPDFSQTRDKDGNDTTQANGGEANASTPSRRFGLLDLLTGNTNSAASTAATSPSNGFMDASRGLLGLRPIADGSATNAGVANTDTTSGTPPVSTLSNTGSTAPSATLTQFNGNQTFTGYPYPSIAVPSSPSVNTAPTFTGYPPATGVSSPASTPYTGGYTGYPASPSVAPNYSNTYAPSTYNSAPYGNVQYGTQPNLNPATGVNTVPVTSGSPQGGYPSGAVSETEVQTPIVPYSVPNSTPGRYIGNGEINTFGNP
ncbi:MAG: hypothetical protein EAZ61_07645 [Oscillatoriales cyanobacterium]|nr:MAG: hypothetical protein EAZ61_07645 [Oscillatoriales cyanobacterium]